VAGGRRRQRSDARHSIVAILGAAAETLRATPDASVDDIARAAGVSRQTVYAHFPSREALLDAVVEQATAEVKAAFDRAGLDQGPPGQGRAGPGPPGTGPGWTRAPRRGR
jgi:AcrR family transcriptional regulator